MGKLFGFVKGWKSKRSKNTDDHALDILPSEIWTMILYNVDSFEDRWNCYNTCSTWRDILLLEPVYSWGIDKIFPGIVKHLDFESVLNCRLVSKTWCDSIDKLAGNNAKLRPYDKDLQKDTVAPLLHASHFTSPLWSLTSVAKMESLIDELQDFPEERCPIVGRYLKMDYLTDEEEIPEEIIEEHQDLACELINLMGRHVYYFDFVYDPSQFSMPIELCALIGRQLADLPNLRMFKINNCDVDPVNWSLADDDALRLYICRHDPLPHIPTLESLILPLEHHIGAPRLILDHILWIHSAQLKKLEIPLSRLTPIFFQRLTSLTELTVTIDSKTDIRNLLLSVAPLQKLKIMMRFATTLLVEYLLEVIAHFPQLKELCINLEVKCYVQDADRDVYKKWDCSSVKRLSVDFETKGGIYDCSDCCTSLNFLTAFTSVEHVHVIKRVICLLVTRISMAVDNNMQIHICSHTSIDQSQRGLPSMEVVKLRDFMHSGNMYKSNIWELLPNLQSFRYQRFDGPSGSVEHFYSRQVIEGMRKHKNKLRRRVGKVLGKAFVQTMSMFL